MAASATAAPAAAATGPTASASTTLGSAVSVESSISAALVRANFAAEQDARGRTLDAAEYYIAAANILSDVALSPKLNAQQRLQCRELARMYMTRLQKMALAPPPLIKEIEFEETPIVVVNRSLPPPNLMMRRSFWLMRVWGKTILTGGYITPQLHVPRAMWYQSGMKLTAIPQKLECCEQVLDYLLKLPSEDLTNEAAFLTTLDEFCETLDSIQVTLDKHLHCVAAVKKPDAASSQPTSASQKLKDKMRKIGSTISKASTRLGNSVKLDDNTAYVELLLQVFTKAQFIDEWVDEFKSKATVRQRLDRISSFFYLVVCTFVLEDFNLLLDRYTKQMRASFLP